MVEGLAQVSRRQIRCSELISLAHTEFSDCGLYRWTLRRDFTTGRDKVVFIMLNPSTADAQIDDPTTRRAVDFSRHVFNCGNYLAVNLFALRSFDPKALKTVADPVGDLNDQYILAAAEWADTIVVAWGNAGVYLDRDKRVLELLTGKRLWCLGRNNTGTPTFPLYIRKDTTARAFQRVIP